ncbi:hypothetical protein M409DRAFT_24682 [Zasmidium cellare ATCC 36951]|uniref:Rhodopsin domain-containing protein n=1 Tax=Zasmidium cellare ATCC 36951 TaxID=1080233 RepID=A0A6A6CC59_ZASCE|nr:uncharacterized protein M409DRAFT_24682 [Zasmidium cellare ATCC 36951]KAF2164777.1 hypothetical protein M409DRAFT_24682 [Zasmidium cellare ATCC 36951]
MATNLTNPIDPARGAFDLAAGSQYIAIVSTTAIIWSILVFLVRAFLRMKVNGPFGWDDGACAAATIFGTSFSTIALVDVSYGLGEDIEHVANFHRNTFFLLLWCQSMLYMFASCFAQVSVAFLICRIAKVRMHLVLAYGLAIASGLCCLISTFLVVFACRFPTPWILSSTTCTINRWDIWLGNSIISGLVELFLVKTAVLLV